MGELAEQLLKVKEPAEVAEALNQKGHRTSHGGPWAGEVVACRERGELQSRQPT